MKSSFVGQLRLTYFKYLTKQTLNFQPSTHLKKTQKFEIKI